MNAPYLHREAALTGNIWRGSSGPGAASELRTTGDMKPAAVRRATVVAVGEPMLPSWLETAAAQALHLLELRSNWNSYGAKPIQQSLVESMVDLLIAATSEYPRLPAPSIVPTPDGGVQAEWHTHGIDLEIEAIGVWRYVIVATDRVTGEEWDGEVSTNLEPLAKWLARLTHRSEI